MKVVSLLTALALAFSASVVMAEPGAGEKGAGEKGKDGKRPMMQPRDCSKVPAENKERCEARNKVLEACKGKEGEARRDCMKEAVGKMRGQN